VGRYRVPPALPLAHGAPVAGGGRPPQETKDLRVRVRNVGLSELTNEELLAIIEGRATVESFVEETS
jgi:hypothetical protein